MITGRSFEANAVSRIAQHTSRKGTPLLMLGPCTTRGSRFFADGVEAPLVLDEILSMADSKGDEPAVEEEFFEAMCGTRADIDLEILSRIYGNCMLLFSRPLCFSGSEVE